jgi:RNA polymerase sigma factor (sigma-70 family)
MSTRPGDSAFPQRGEPAMSDDLLQRHLPSLHAYVRLKMGRLLAGREGSLDLVQSACREVLQDLPERPGLSESHLRHWLFVAAERKIIDRVRYLQAAKRDARLDALPAPGSSESATLSDLYATLGTPSQVVQGRELLERMEQAFAGLSEEHREVILLARLGGLSHAEIAAQKGSSEGAIRTLLYRALGKLGAALGRED